MLTSTFFDAAFETRVPAYAYDRVLEIVLDFETRIQLDPWEPGEPHPAFEPIGSVMVYESPAIGSTPQFVLSYQIEETEGVVRLLNFHVR